MNKKIVYLLLGLILIVGFILRNHNLNRWPREGATFDEYAWTFLGMSILEAGIPTSWSPHAAYKQKVQYINPHGTSFFLSTPYLEHPPLFGLIAGGFAKLQGAKTFDDVTVERIRPLALFLGIVSIFSVYLLATSVYGSTIGLSSAFVYAVIPTVVAGSRIVQNENFFIPLFLLTIWSGFTFTKTKKKRYLIGSIALSFLLLLSKMPFVAAGGALILLYLYTKQFKGALWTVISILGALFLFFCYGYYFDREVFLNLWKLQLARYDMTFNSIFTLFTDPIVTDRLFLDGWLYFGWFAIVLLCTELIKKHWPILLAFGAYLGVYLFAIPSEPGHGWYRYPLYPFMAIATGYFFVNYFNKNYILTFLFLILTGLSMFHHAWLPFFGFSYGIYRAYIILCAFGTLPLFFPSGRIQKIATGINYFLFCAVILFTFGASWLYNEQ